MKEIKERLTKDKKTMAGAVAAAVSVLILIGWITKEDVEMTCRDAMQIANDVCSTVLSP